MLVETTTRVSNFDLQQWLQAFSNKIEENRQEDKKELEENRQKDKKEQEERDKQTQQTLQTLQQKLENKLEQNQQKLEEKQEQILEETRVNTAQIRTIYEGDEKTTAESPTTEIVINNNNEVNRTEPDDSMEGVEEEPEGDGKGEEEKEEKEAEEPLRRLGESPAELEHSVQSNETPTLEGSQEEIEKVEPENYREGMPEEKEEDKLQRRLWEEEAADPQTAETVKINLEPPVLVVIPNPASKCDVTTLFSEIKLPHHVEKFQNQRYREICHEIVRRQNQRKWCNIYLRRKVKQKNIRRKKKAKVSWDLRLAREAKIHKQCKSYQWQQSSNPYRKEVRDEGGTVKVVPLGQQIELISY
jgi:hypothetical protein